jgi:hypothetical protein
MLAASFDQSYVDVTSGAGTRTRYFDKDGSNVYRSAGGIGSSLKKNAGGDWTESFPDGFQYNYTSTGLASSIVFPAGFRKRLRGRGRAGAKFSVFGFQFSVGREITRLQLTTDH